VSKIVIPDAPPEPTQQADMKAGLCAEASGFLEQAGRGLFAAIQDCEAGTPSAKTIIVLNVVGGYINDAQNKLIEREFSGINVAG
jgi:hypothetical protein